MFRHGLAPCRQLPSTAWHRSSSTYSHLPQQLTARKTPLYYDHLTRERSFRLNVSLADFLPAGPSVSKYQPIPSTSETLPPSHHFLYCEPSNTGSRLLPDGTNPEHFPASPFHRRLWAGGSIQYNPDKPFRLDEQPIVCLETIRGAQVLGLWGQERVSLSIERRLSYLENAEVDALTRVNSDPSGTKAVEDQIRHRLWRDDEADFGPCSLLEKRRIVFLQHQDQADSDPKSFTRHGSADTFSHTMTPDKHLLFRYSALTFNAHAIHLDPVYSRHVEHHRNLLVHGSLSLSCLLMTLQSTLRTQGIEDRITRVDYRNLAPLYCDEPIKLCGKRMLAGSPGRYELWAATPAGGLATWARVQTGGG